MDVAKNKLKSVYFLTPADVNRLALTSGFIMSMSRARPQMTLTNRTQKKLCMKSPDFLTRPLVKTGE